MAVPTTAWAETTPAAGSVASAGDDRIREMKTQLREVIANDHQMASSGADAAGTHKHVHIQSIDAFTDGDTTPDVSGSSFFKTANTGATSITDFDTETVAKVLVIKIEDANTTLVHGANKIYLSGAANWTPASGDTLTLLFDGTDYFELARSDNT